MRAAASLDLPGLPFWVADRVSISFSPASNHPVHASLTDTIGFAHSFYEKKKRPISFSTDFLTPLLYECCSKIGVTPGTVYFAKVFMTVAIGNTQRNLFHTDMHTPHLVCLYYVNDSSGPTVILNKTYEDIGRDEVNARDQSGNIAREVEPRQGRVVLFNGKYYHASSNPESGRRCIVNYDVEPLRLHERS